MPTDYRFTGQRLQAQINLYHMGARFYEPALGTWVSPDSLIPLPAGPRSFNRYSYVGNRPLVYQDPSGQAECLSSDCRLLEHPATGNVFVIDPGDSGLYKLIQRISTGRDTAIHRLEQVLGETQGAGLSERVNVLDTAIGGRLRTHFQGLGGIHGDVGFSDEFEDDHLYTDVWGYDAPASRQTGHLLTAIDMGYHQGWIYSIVAHELYPDPGLGVVAQLGLPTTADLLNFRAAMEADASGILALVTQP